MSRSLYGRPAPQAPAIPKPNPQALAQDPDAPGSSVLPPTRASTARVRGRGRLRRPLGRDLGLRGPTPIACARERGVLQRCLLGIGLLGIGLLGLSACKRAPKVEEIRVRILTKHHPRQLRLRGAGCQLDPSMNTEAEAAAEAKAAPAEASTAEAEVALKGGAPETPELRLSIDQGQVKVCAQGRCELHPQATLRCAAPMSLDLPTLPARRYGRQLEVGVDGEDLRLVATLPLEAYVAGVVRSELARAPPAARQAQAVLARSFALRAKAHPRHPDAALCDLTHCQAFAGILRAPSPAQAQTAGWVLRTPSGEVAAAYYHSTCGGHTLAANALWDNADPAVVGVSDAKPGGGNWCDASRHSFWMHEVTEAQLASALRRLFGRRPDPRSLRIQKTGPLRFTISDRRGRRSTSAERLHVILGRKLGWSAVKSNELRFERAGRRFWIRGRGLGHRVGFCQHGAIARAEAGATAEQLLKAYFPKLHLHKP